MILYAGNILSSHGYTPTFIETLAPKLAGRYKITVVSDKLSQPLRLFDMIRTFLRLRKNLDLVLIDSYSMKAFWFTYALAKLSMMWGIPYIPILRGGGYPERLKSSPSLCREIFGNAYRNISPSLYLMKHFVDEGFKVDYIPNFIPLEHYKYRVRNVLRPRLFWVRSFHEIYNPVMALKVIEIVSKSYPEAQLCMVGPDKDGSLKIVEDEIEKMGIKSSVKLTGKLSKAEWARLSEDYDIFINTTNFDNHPVSVIEAMALGMPVVSTRVGGIPYLIEDGADGLLARAGDANDFSEKVITLLKDSENARKIASNARSKVEEFDWESVSTKWQALIDPLIKRQNGMDVVS